MDGEAWEGSIGLSGEEHGAAVAIALDGADDSVSEEQRAIDPATSAGEESDLTHPSPMR